MASFECPRCGLYSPSTALRCDCGYDFAARMRPADVPERLFAEFTRHESALRGLFTQSSLLAGGMWLLVAMAGLYVTLSLMIGDARRVPLANDGRFVRLVAVALGPPMLMQVIGGTVAIVRCTAATRFMCYVRALGGALIATALYLVLSLLSAALNIGMIWIDAVSVSWQFMLGFWWILVATAVVGAALTVDCHKRLTSKTSP